MALPDDGPEGRAHRAALQSALFLALSSPEAFVREEAIRTAGKLAKWGGVYGMTGSLDGIVGEWLDAMIKHGPGTVDGGGSGCISEGATATGAPASSPEGMSVGPGASTESYWLRTQSSHLAAVAEVVSNSRPDSISDRVARLCLDTSREYLFSRDRTVREAAARVLGNTLNSVEDADAAANVMREMVVMWEIPPGSNNDDLGSVGGSIASTVRAGGRAEDVIVKHGRLIACDSILTTQWGSQVMSTRDISDAVLKFIHACIKNKNSVVRAAAYHATGSVLGKSPAPDDARLASSTTTKTSTCPVLKKMRSAILKATRASECVDVQLAPARGLTSAARTRPGVFLCKGGMPVMDAALMLAMSGSHASQTCRRRSRSSFGWRRHEVMGDDVAYDRGANVVGGGNGTGCHGNAARDFMSSPGLEKYIKLAEGENGRIMMKFVTQTLARIEDLDDRGGIVC